VVSTAYWLAQQGPRTPPHNRCSSAYRSAHENDVLDLHIRDLPALTQLQSPRLNAAWGETTDGGSGAKLFGTITCSHTSM